MGDESTSGYSAFDYLEGYNYNSGGAVLDGEWILGSQYRGLPVTDLSWQKVKMFNVGLEYGFFENRLTGELNYFTRTLEGIPASPGITLPERIGIHAAQREHGFAEDPRHRWKPEMERQRQGFQLFGRRQFHLLTQIRVETRAVDTEQLMGKNTVPITASATPTNGGASTASASSKTGSRSPNTRSTSTARAIPRYVRAT